MSDVFTITVLVPKGAYPTVNNLGMNSHRGGRKTPEYHELGSRILAAAKAEMKRTGWQTITYACFGSITRYQSSARMSDASNLGKCEMDYLEHAGVIANDSLIRPIVKDIQYDPDGVDRIVIVLQRLYPRLADVQEVSKVKKTTRKRKASGVSSALLAKKGRKDEVGYVNGRAVSMNQARRYLK